MVAGMPGEPGRGNVTICYIGVSRVVETTCH